MYIYNYFLSNLLSCMSNAWHPVVKYCIHMETSPLLAKGCKTPVLSQLLWPLSRDDLYLVIPSVTSNLGFCDLILRYTPFSLPVRQLKCNSHCIRIWILTGTSTLVKETCFSQWAGLWSYRKIRLKTHLKTRLRTYLMTTLRHILGYKRKLSKSYPKLRCPELVCLLKKIVVYEIIHKIILQKLFWNHDTIQK